MSQGYPTTGVGKLVNFVSTDQIVGMQGIHETSTTQKHPVGTRCKARDMGPAQLGDGEFIYLQGVASTAAGSVVTYDQVQGITQLLVDDGTPEAGPLAVAMSANVAGPNWGWYQIFGQAIVLTADGTINTPAMINATAGSVKTTGETTTDLIAGMVFTSTFGPAATTVAAGSNATFLPQASISITSSTGLTNAPAMAKITSTNGQQIVRYTGAAANALTGGTLGSGELLTGQVVEAFPGTGFALAQLSYPAYSGGVVPA